MKQLMLGNDAVARGAYEAGVKVVSAYPGTPSTEITECIARYDEVYAEWAPNEKVAMETAIGASLAGVRSMCAMKHVGVNVAADPLLTVAYTGVNGGLVICAADDPGMHSSQNEQDTRHYARLAKIPVIEPSDSGECRDYMKKAFEISETFDTPVILRLSTRVSHSQSLVEPMERVEKEPKAYEKDIPKFVMMPANARGRHVVVEERYKKLQEFAATTSLNRIENPGKEIGVITGGTSYVYAKEALGDSVSYLKLGMMYPLSDTLLKEFAGSVKELWCLEELDPFVEDYIKSLGIAVHGKDKLSLIGEYTAEKIAAAVLGETKEIAFKDVPAAPMRPPVLCPGCPHRATFSVLSGLKYTVFGDIGCYTLGAAAPLAAIDSVVCMGAGIGMAHGAYKAGLDKRSVAVIGDSTFIHSGITGLINAVYNKSNTTILILDNGITGMTGHQNNPANGLTLKNEKTKQVDIVKLAESIGCERVFVVDPFHRDELKEILERETQVDDVSVIIARRPCVLLPGIKQGPKVQITDACRGCKACMRIGCPAICFNDGKASIDINTCVGCGLCLDTCKFSAMELLKEDK